MGAPTTAVSGYDVLISWAAPTDGGLPITGYEVVIKNQAGVYVLEETYCSVSVTSCSVPLLTLQDSPYELELGDLVQARIRAVNLIGVSIDSSHNTDGALIETVPSAPPVAPVRSSATSMT